MSATVGEPAGAERDILDTTEAGGAAIRGGSLRVGVYILNALLSAGTAAILFRHLGVTDAGYYVTVLSIAAVVSGLSDLGLTMLGVRELSVREGSERAAVVTNLMGLRLTLTAIGIGIAAAFAAVADYRRSLVVAILAAGGGVLLQTLQDGLTISLQTRLRLGWAAALDLLRQILTAVLVVTLVLAGAGLVSFLAVPIPVGLVVLVLTARLVRHDIPLRPRFQRAEWVRMLRAFIPYSIAVALGVLYFRATIIALSLIAPSDQLGYFATSFRILEVLIGVPALLVGAAFPIFSRSARDDHDRLAYATGRVFEASLIAGAGLAATLFLGAAFAVRIIGGVEFAPAAGVLRIQTIALAAIFVNTVWTLTLLSLGRYRDLMYISIVALGGGLVLAVVLSAVGGAYGAATATAIAEVGICLLSAAAVARAKPGLLPSMRVLPRVALAAALAVALYAIPAPSVVLMVAGAVVYLAVIALTGALPPEIVVELRLLRARWSRASATRG